MSSNPPSLDTFTACCFVISKSPPPPCHIDSMLLCSLLPAALSCDLRHSAVAFRMGLELHFFRTELGLTIDADRQ
jgi:hypothetical protein